MGRKFILAVVVLNLCACLDIFIPQCEDDDFFNDRADSGICRDADLNEPKPWLNSGDDTWSDLPT